MSQAFYRKWRPRKWEAVVGQDHVIQTLHNAVASKRIAHAYLFAGPRGTGKTTTARILAKAVNCLDPDLAVRPCDQCEHCLAVNAGRFLDLIEIDAASNTSVDDVRELRDKINFSPNQGRYKVYVVDEVHMLSIAAFNALLKTLEEPPPHAIFILATTEAHKIPATVLSRCQRHEFRRIPVTEIFAYLNGMIASEGLQVSPEALELIARQATGSLRDAVSLLDQLASTGQEISLGLAQSVLGTATNQAVIAVVSALIAHDPAVGLDQIHRALDSGSDPRQFARQMVDYLRDLLLIRMNNADQVDATKEVRAQMDLHAQAFTTPELLQVIRAFNHAANDARATWQPALPLEIAIIESCEQPPVTVSGNPHSYNPPTPTKSQTQPDKVVSTTQSLPPTKETKSASIPEESHLAQTLKENWPQVLSLVRRQNPNTYGLLNSCQSRFLDGKVLTLGFASDLLKNQMAKKENLALVQQALLEVVGIEIAVRCMINTAKRSTIPTEVDDKGMVAAALRDLGGEIVDIQ